jgi:hypothetical protein
LYFQYLFTLFIFHNPKIVLSMWGQWDYISYDRGVQLILFQFVVNSVYIPLGLLSYLSGCLHITSLIDARENCKSTLPSVRTFLISSSTVFLSFKVFFIIVLKPDNNSLLILICRCWDVLTLVFYVDTRYNRNSLKP